MRAFNCCKEQSNPEELWNEEKYQTSEVVSLSHKLTRVPRAVALKPLNATEPVRDVAGCRQGDRAVWPGCLGRTWLPGARMTRECPFTLTEDTVEPTDGRKDARDCLHACCFPEGNKCSVLTAAAAAAAR